MTSTAMPGPTTSGSASSRPTGWARKCRSAPTSRTGSRTASRRRTSAPADPDFPLLHPVATSRSATITSSATSRSSSRWTVQMMMAAFTNMETVHIDAYALLLKTLGMPQDRVRGLPRLCRDARQGRLHAHLRRRARCADVARTLAMFGAFTEGMSLFASFAMLLNFPRHNKMNGMGQIVSWSVRDESLHCEGIIKLYPRLERRDRRGHQGGARRHHRCRQDHGRAGRALRRSGLRPGRDRGHDAGAKSNAYVRYIADWRLTQLKLPTGVRHISRRPRAATSSSSRIRCPGWWKSSTASSTPISSSSAPPNIPRARAAAPGTATSGVWAQFDKRNRSRRNSSHAIRSPLTQPVISPRFLRLFQTRYGWFRFPVTYIGVATK